jgi:hypothetical protein
MVTLSMQDAALVPHECRRTALEMLRGAPDWDKRDLAAWLTGPYRHVTRHVWHGERTVVVPAGVTLSGVTVREVCVQARDVVLAALAQAQTDGMRAIAADAVSRGRIVPAVSALGGCWVANDATARLADRVLALLAVDWLARPRDYANALFVCRECESVRFHAEMRASGACPMHPRNSQITGVSEVAGSRTVRSA